MKDLKNFDEKKCTICETKVDIDKQGGLRGFFGIVPVVFCDFCLNCVLDLAEQANPNNKLT